MDNNATTANEGAAKSAVPPAGQTPPAVRPLHPVEAMRRMATASFNSSPASLDASEMERLARRYRREAQLALEGALWWAISWPFELMSALVNAGRKWEEEYFQTAPRRRVPLDEEDER